MFWGQSVLAFKLPGVEALEMQVTDKYWLAEEFQHEFQRWFL